jgi:putative membrane protein
MKHVCTPVCASVVLAATLLAAGCDGRSVPPPERRTAPAEVRPNAAPDAERKSADPTAGRKEAEPGAGRTVVPPDTPSPRSLDGGPASAPKPQTGSLSPADRAFVAQAAATSLYEAEAGRMAATKGTSSSVRAFGTMLVTQHRAVNTELQALANSHGLALPPTVSAEQRDKLERLAQLNGSAFDREFAQSIGVADHEAAIEKFASASRDAENPQLREWIQKTLPALQEHLQEAKQLVAAR